jgi:ankyrin repeat protein
MWASQNGHIGAIQLLLDTGADVNAQDNVSWGIRRSVADALIFV